LSRSTLEPLASRGEQLTTEEITVPVTTLDGCVERYGIDRIGFLKIDVEGHEHAVLRGAAKTLEGQRPIVLMEAEQRHHDFPLARVFESLQAIGYQGFFVDMTAMAMRPLAAFDVQRHQAPEYHGSRQYVANFIFIPSEAASMCDTLNSRLRALASNATK
jgi:hypothetical protein